MTKVSVIIPYHNVEEYIAKSIESVKNQTIGDIEIICIDDASTDKSADIVQQYAQTDGRIKMLSINKQSGQGFARNIGLKEATGEYIGFVDSDDWVEPDMFEKLYNAAKSVDSDITMCQACLFDDKTQETSTDDYYSLKCLEKYVDKTFCATDTKDEILNINVVLWNKLYRREFLVKTGEKFPEGFIYEDLPFFFGTYLKAERINIVWEKLYYYRQNRRYSTMQNSDKKVYDRIPMVSLTYDKLKRAPFYEEKETEILSWIIDDIFHRYTLLEEKYYKEYFYMMKKFFQSFAPNGDDIYKLATCYCFEEYMSILKNHYFDFWKFLIEKYKFANKRVKAAQHEKNLYVKDIQEYLIKYKKEQYEEREEVLNWWRKAYNEAMKFHYSHCKVISENYENELKRVYSDYNGKLVQQEYDLKKWSSYCVRKKEEELRKFYEWKMGNLRFEYNKALMNQKEYYENNFLMVKLNMRVKKSFGQIKNKIKRFLKKN